MRRNGLLVGIKVFAGFFFTYVLLLVPIVRQVRFKSDNPAAIKANIVPWLSFQSVTPVTVPRNPPRSTTLSPMTNLCVSVACGLLMS